MDVSQYLQMFIEESKDNLQRLNENLLKLENTPEDIQTLNEIFRVAHTLKGMAGTMGFTRMQKLTHNIENVLSEIRTGKIKVNSNMLDTLFQCLDALENYVEEIINTAGEGTEDYAQLISELERIVNQKKEEVVETSKERIISASPSHIEIIALPEAQETIKNKALAMDMNVFQVNIHLSANCVLKSARAFVIFTDLERMGEIIHCIPSVQDIEDEQFEDSFVIVFVTKESQQRLQEVILGVSEVSNVEIVALHQGVQEKVITSAESQIEENQETHLNSAEANAQQNGKQQVSSKTVRVNIDRLDTLMNLVSELIIVKTQLEGLNVNVQDSSSNYNDSVEYLERVTTSLHDAVMKVRMVPVETVFNRFPRLIRDVSRKLGKDIELVMLGEETELDRTVIDEIGDPLIHLLRNAADHGLETTEARIASGKPKKGTIRLEAYQDGNSVVIEVQDDGKGIDVSKIKNKAIQKGTITKEEAGTMSDQEIVELLFRPSFSTSEEITDLSGRGVGLDVVKSKITTLGGHVEVQTELNKGSIFRIRLPLTLAIIQALMINIGSEKYAIPLNNIQNIEDVRKEDIKLVQKQEVIVVRDEIIPIIRLHRVLGLPEQEDKELMMGVIVKKGERQVGFIIDSLIGQQEIVIKSLGKYLSGIDIIAGATILGNGEVALILDVNSLI
ncbi:chemotaxis protein CheA [Sporanaerobium hydrogeniformans]|uniref:Chemotaxis protein CheA n=1 Tax=Sporanaerobium hydrogeniformans TaxID=3072179 RepID=A0AC61DFB2_9FIRM|nr:chemotaxis protein CheA [Sporanaerobium hydrogeniformans]PHV71763.1 chemotaxis protein CheA [Sporanaerobium hydrogeniformans]